MSTTKRRSRRQRENRDPIERAWDTGERPPAEAFLPENHERVEEVIFWRWCEADVETYGSRDKQHPHLGEWLAALEGV